MAINVKGVMHGRRIELDSDPGLPDGAPVEVEISCKPASPEERRRQMKAYWGIWKDDEAIGQIFESIASERVQSRPRSTDFDAAP